MPFGYAFPIPMRIFRFFPAVIAFSMFLSVAAVDGPLAYAQSVDDAEDDADDAKEKADAATGLVDSAVAEREQIERELTESIARLNELSAQLSIVGAGLDRTAQQLGFADVELASIQAQIEVQAVDAYMTVLSSPTVSLVNSESVEKALVASSVVEDVVASGRANVDELIIKRRSLQQLHLVYLEEQDEYQTLQEEVDAEVEHLAGLYDQADRAVATAVSGAAPAARLGQGRVRSARGGRRPAPLAPPGGGGLRRRARARRAVRGLDRALRPQSQDSDEILRQCGHRRRDRHVRPPDQPRPLRRPAGQSARRARGLGGARARRAGDP